MSAEVGAFLKRQLQQIQAKNPQFSGRSLARKAQIPAGKMSELIQGKRTLTLYNAEKIIRALNLEKDEQLEFMALVKKKGRKVSMDYQLHEREVAVLSSWEHFAVLNLMELSEFESSNAWISQRLGIPQSKVQEILDTLISLQLTSLKDGKYVRTHKHLTTTMDIQSTAIQTSLVAHMEKAIQVLRVVPPTQRDYSNCIYRVNTKNIKKAKKLIENFQDRLAILLEEGHQNEVYNLSIQFFPLTLPAQELA